MGDSVCLEAMLEMALSMFPLFEGGSEHNADVERSEDDPAEICSVSFTTWKELRYIDGGYLRLRQMPDVKVVHRKNIGNLGALFQRATVG